MAHHNNTTRVRGVHTEEKVRSDAELIALASRIVESDKRFLEINEAFFQQSEVPPHVAAETKRLVRRKHEDTALMAKMPAKTLAGLQAKALALLTRWAPDEPPDEQDDMLLAWSLARDLKGISA